MNYYEVTFYKKEYDKERDKTEYIKLGHVEINDFGVGDKMSLPGKAFRHAPPKCMSADSLKIEPVRK